MTPKTSKISQLLDEGETGPSVAFDVPTLMGYDNDSPRAHAEIGKCGDVKCQTGAHVGEERN